jgi:hypothetical protein
MKYKLRKETIVDAHRQTMPGITITIKGIKVEWPVGFWGVNHPNGDIEILSDKDFNNKYEVIQEYVPPKQPIPFRPQDDKYIWTAPIMWCKNL